MAPKPFRHPQLTEMDRIARQRRKESREKLDLDVDAYIRQVKALPVFKDAPRSIAHTKVVLTHTAFGQSGYAHGNKRALIRSTFAPLLGDLLDGHTQEAAYQKRIVWLLNTIVHELVHCALPDRTVHNERFRLTLARATRELWGFEVDPNPKTGAGRVACYGLDLVIEERLELELREGRVSYPKLVPVAPESKEAARAAQRAARAAHAAQMLAKAETRLKRAETIAKKWRARVKRLNTSRGRNESPSGPEPES